MKDYLEESDDSFGTGATSTHCWFAMLRVLFRQSKPRRDTSCSIIRTTSSHVQLDHISRAILDIRSMDSNGPSASALSRSKLSLYR
jgi:hypothetical protein